MCMSVCETDCVKCNGGCARMFHLKRVNVQLIDIQTRWSKNWKCNRCKEEIKSKTSSVSNTLLSTELSNEFVVKTLEAFKTEMSAEIRSNAEFTSLFQFMSALLLKLIKWRIT